MIGYARRGANRCDEAPRFCIRDLDGKQLNAFCMDEQGS